MRCDPEKEKYVAKCRLLQEAYNLERQKAMEMYGTADSGLPPVGDRAAAPSAQPRWDGNKR